MSLGLLSCALFAAQSPHASAHVHIPLSAQAQFESRLDSLYQEVSRAHQENPWFKNEQDPSVMRSWLKTLPMVPEYAMPSRSYFGQALKAYCVLLESPVGSRVKNRARLGIINYSEPSNVRRFYIYDIPQKQIIHQTWTSHAGNSTFGAWRSMKDIDPEKYSQHVKDVIIEHRAYDTASFFSNRPGSEMSSVGMAIADTQTYFSQTNRWNALRLQGVDGPLNNKMGPRAVVFHEWNFDGSQVRSSRKAPMSQGCPMLPTRGAYQGQFNVEIAMLIMNEIRGAPVLLTHDRMDPAVNRAQYQQQKETLKQLEADLTDSFNYYAEGYGWPAEVRQEILKSEIRRLRDQFEPRIEESFQYFQTASLYFGREPKNLAACESALGL
jgi:hypothetical protein